MRHRKKLPQCCGPRLRHNTRPRGKRTQRKRVASEKKKRGAEECAIMMPPLLIMERFSFFPNFTFHFQRVAR